MYLEFHSFVHRLNVINILSIGLIDSESEDERFVLFSRKFGWDLSFPHPPPQIPLDFIDDLWRKSQHESTPMLIYISKQICGSCPLKHTANDIEYSIDNIQRTCSMLILTQTNKIIHLNQINKIDT